jgi:hypothetical protein
MPQKIIEFKEAAGKVVEKITVTNDTEFRAITVRFVDHTAMHFTLHPRIEFEPELMDWKTGDGKVLKEYPTVYEKER